VIGRNRFDSRHGSESEAVGIRYQARNAEALSMAQSRKLFGGAPVISANVEVTSAGWPIAAAQAASSIFTAGSGPIVSNSRRASSGEISTMRSERPMARPMVETCSN